MEMRKHETITGSLVFGLLLSFLTASPGVIYASNYYVSTQGSDSNPGTLTQPLRSIRKGVTVLRAGDTLYIRGGSYAEVINSNVMTIPAGTSWSAAVTIARYPGEEVIMNGSGSATFNLVHGHIQYLIIDGIIINSSSPGGISIGGGANHIRFANCEVAGASGQGIQVGGQSTTSNYNEFINMNVHHNGSFIASNSPQEHGIYLQTSNNLIDGGTWHHNYGYGIQSYNGYGNRANNNVIRNVRAYSNGSGGISISMSDGSIVYNNIVYDNRNRPGISVSWGNPIGTKIYNNTVYSNPTGAGIEVLSGASNTIIKNNIVFQNGGAIVNTGSGTIMSNNLSADPQFVSVSAYDFRLSLGSPAVDTGIQLSEFSTDIDRFPRPQGSGFDIGAHELRTTNQAPAVPSPTNLRIASQ